MACLIPIKPILTIPVLYSICKLINWIRSINLISDAIKSFRLKCLDNIIANTDQIKKNLNNSLMLVTALNPKIGYSKSAEIAKKAHKEKITLKEAALKLNYLSEKEYLLAGSNLIFLFLFSISPEIYKKKK